MTAVINPYEEQPYKNPLNKTNRLLIRTPLARSKPTVHSLPPANHTYGRTVKQELNGVSTALQWDKTSTNNAIRAKLKAKKNIENTYHDVNVSLLVHGKPSEETTSISDIISNTYQRNAIIQAKQKQLQNTQQLNALSNTKTIKHTKASTLHATTKLQEQTPEKPVFKLKQFANVKPRVQMPHIIAQQQAEAAAKTSSATKIEPVVQSTETQSIDVTVAATESQ